MTIETNIPRLDRAPSTAAKDTDTIKARHDPSPAGNKFRRPSISNNSNKHGARIPAAHPPSSRDPRDLTPNEGPRRLRATTTRRGDPRRAHIRTDDLRLP